MADAKPPVEEEIKAEEVVSPSAPPEKPVVEETPEEPLVEEEAVPTPSAPAEEEEKPPSRREQLRVQQLLQRYGIPEKTPDAKGPDFRDKVTADEETYKTLEDTAQQFGKDQYNQGLDRAKYYKWETLLNVDEPVVRSKYPELDPNNKEKFHPALAQTMANRFAMFAGYNPGDEAKGVPRSVQNADIRYLDFVEAEMEYADELASQRVEKTTANIAKQAARTGLRPDGSRAKGLDLNKPPEQMTDEELKAVIGQAGL